MKPPPFAYHAPSTLAEALDVLAEVGDEGKVLAGGQSLIPILNMRLAAPRHLVDINRIAELSYVRAQDDGVRVGATARHAEVERDELAAEVLPVLRRALGEVAHPVIRNRGTAVGSLAHADPAGEMPAVLALLGGTVEVARQAETRVVGADDFFVGPLESCLDPDEIAVSAWFPRPPRRTGTGFAEVARRHGDYALCGLAAAVTLTAEGRVARAWAAYIGVAPTPLVLDLTDPVADANLEMGVDGLDWAGAGALAAERVEPEDDIHASAGYRRHLAAVLTARALRQAAREAVALLDRGTPQPIGSPEGTPDR